MPLLYIPDKYNETVDDDSKSQFTCPLCSKTEVQPSYEHFLRRHTCMAQNENKDHVSPQNQNKNHVCDICHKGFSKLSSLSRHQEMHATARPFACIKCHKSFKTNDALRTHFTVFKDGKCVEAMVEKPYVCHTCGARYQTKRSLQRHKADQHLPVNERTVKKSIESVDGDGQVFTCETCGKSYQTNRSLKRHIYDQHKGVYFKILTTRQVLV